MTTRTMISQHSLGSMTKLIISVDPGKTGSASLFRDGKLFDVLVFGIKPSKGPVRVTEGWNHTLHNMCRCLKPAVHFEHVHNLPGQGGSTMWDFATSTERALSAVTLAECSVQFWEPQAWQRKLGLPHNYHLETKEKRRAQGRKDQKAMALQLFPEFAQLKGDWYASALIGWAAMQP